MEKLTLAWRRGLQNDRNTGQNENGRGRGRGVRGNGAWKQPAVRRTQINGGGPDEWGPPRTERVEGGRGRGRNAGAARGDGGRGRGGRGNNRPGHEERQYFGERWGGRDDKRSSSQPQERKLGYRQVQNLSKDEPSVIAFSLSSHPGFQTQLANPKMSKDFIHLNCLVINKAFTSRTDRGTLQHLAGVIKDSRFFHVTLIEYVGGMMSEYNACRRELYPQDLENITDILTQVLNIFPASSVKAVSILLTLLPAAINSLRASGVDIQPDIEEKVDQLKRIVDHLQAKSRDGTLRSDRDTYALLPNHDENGDQDAQPDFRTIPLYPTPEEFHQEHRPFLRRNITSQRYTNTHIYLDTHFRLLREDFVRPLREGVQQLLRNQIDMGRMDNPAKAKRLDDIRVYFNTQLVAPRCTQMGLAYVVQFDIQPLKFVRWQNSKRLLYGSLVCLTYDNFDNFLFATVSDRDLRALPDGLIQITFTEESRQKLARIQPDQLFLMVETTAYFEAYRHVLEGLKEQPEDNLPFQKYIVECCTDVQPPAYLNRDDSYNLSEIAVDEHKRNMQPFHCLGDTEWPTMEALGLDESQMRAFKLALTKELAIVQGPPGTGKTYVGLKIAQALLTNEHLWNGKSSDEEEDDGKSETGPMLVVCYTNHALDQFLEGIYKFLRRGIVRVGGRSNSDVLKRFNLRELTHSHLFRQALPNHLRAAHSQIHCELYQQIEKIEFHSNELECSLKGVLRESFLEPFISETHWKSLTAPPQCDGFDVWIKKSSLMMEWLAVGFGVFQQRETEITNDEFEEVMEQDEDYIAMREEADLIQEERMIEDDWIFPAKISKEERRRRNKEMAVREVEETMLALNLNKIDTNPEQNEDSFQISRDQRKKLKKRIKRELGKTSTMTQEQEESVHDVWSLDIEDRWKLYRLWVLRYKMEMRTKGQAAEQSFQLLVDRLTDVKRRENIEILKKAKVIGMTTTGAAKFREALQELRPRVVIVEEAAEVLEAHIITTLSKGCQHLILIGDHQQLRPSATVYELAKNFNLEMSMFERLVRMGLPFERLNYQHRMRPEIASLLTPHIYSDLQNHPSVHEYENIKGIKTNLFFVEHTYPEEEIKDGRSHQNVHEAKFVVALCRYLLLQDYEPGQITILTTYTGQLNCLRTQMPTNNFTGVKVHVVDKYQGEENDIVLLSLVRSNPQGEVGFLSIPNRICVALSRAKKGLYCIGNSSILKRINLWSNIFHIMRERGEVGAALTLCCQNHPDRQIQASCSADFKKAPEGGCTEPCQFRLDCGHVCSRVCHPYDAEHTKFQCMKKCEKVLCDQGHKCTLMCHMECPEQCSEKVMKKIPLCQHLQEVPCHLKPQQFLCQDPCEKLLRCGHPCDDLCGMKCPTVCMVNVTLNLQCGHIQDGACHYQTEDDGPECKAQCEHTLECGHPCRGTCGRCYQGRFHLSCFHRCEQLLICSHKCMEPCTRNCPPCQRPCENCCVHSKCRKRCGEPCAPCIEPCAWQCPHQSCSKLCYEPCDRPPCTKPCTNTLDCGHPCIGLCGDKCPSKCRICHHDEVTEIFFGTEDEPDARFIELLDCGHIIESTAMDQYMTTDTSSFANGEDKVAIKLKECPKCKTPIRKNLRYGSHINRSLAEIEMVKKKINETQPNISQGRRILQSLWKENLAICDKHLTEDYQNLKRKLEKKDLTAMDLWVVENRIDFLVKVAKLKDVEQKSMLFDDSHAFHECVERFLSWLNDPFQKFSDQQVFDLQRELCRLDLLAELNARCYMAKNKKQTDEIQAEVQDIRDVLQTVAQFSEEHQLKVKEALKKLDAKLPLTGLRVSEEERKMIVSAMKMPLGHWYKCPNGHVYLITECGGAMESRQCPDCDAVIGGADHHLHLDNLVATEMDGSQHPAWSEANNLLNFDQVDIDGF